MIDTGKVWYQVMVGEFNIIQAESDSFILGDPYFAEDTVYYRYSFYFWCREDAIEKKIYKRGFYNHTTPNGPEELFYDFSLKEGDSIRFPHLMNMCSYTGWLKVDSIREKVFIQKPVKVFYLNDYYPGAPNIIWVEGIGSLAGFVNNNSYIELFGCGELTCFYQNDTLIYQSPNGAYWGCSFEHVDVGDLEPDFNVKLYPNPVCDISNLIFNNAKKEEFTFKIFDILGKQLDIQTTQSSDFSICKNHLKPGIYFYLLIKENQIIYSNKFLIQ